MYALLAFRHLALRPARTLLLLAGYGVGVAVMVVLLSIGEALLAQARDEKLVGGGDITVLPEGIDVEVMKTGGLGGMYFSIDHARFIQLQLLASPRLAADVKTAGQCRILRFAACPSRAVSFIAGAALAGAGVYVVARKPSHGALTMDPLLIIIVVLLVLWLGGFAFSVGGGLIHILLVIALVVIVVRLLQGRKVL